MVPAFVVFVPGRTSRERNGRPSRCRWQYPRSQSIIVITEIGVRAKRMNPDVAAALICTGLLSILLFRRSLVAC
jgi:hypothetical protein